MIIDSKGRLFGKVSIIDVLIVLVLAAVIALVGLKFFKTENESPFAAKADELVIVFYQEEASEFAAKAVKVGDPVREQLQNANFARVTDVKVDKSVSWVKTGKGEYVKGTKKGYSSIYVTMEGTGVYGNNGVKIGNGEYFIGQSVVLYIGDASFYGKIYDMKKK